MIYTRADLKQAINKGIQGRIGVLLDVNSTLNSIVRQVLSSVHLRSNRRRAQLSPFLFSSVYRYLSPSDLMANRIISIRPQVLDSQSQRKEQVLVPSEQFDLLKEDNTISIDDYNGQRFLNLSIPGNDKSLVLSTLDTLTSGGGTWTIFGDAVNLAVDGDNFVMGNASLKFNISAAAGTTAGIYNSALNAFDLDNDYLGGNGAIFVWHYITSTANITNYKLRIGSDASNYHEKTITSQHDGTAFVIGWNYLRFDLTSMTDTGSSNNDAIDYIALFMTKTTGKISETDYHFDHITIKKGQIWNIHYYSKYGWQSAAGSYLENSTDDSDLLMADTDEFELFVQKGIEIVAQEANQYDISDRAVMKFKELAANYRKENPSEAKIITSKYYNY